ncbi:hypothetical protein FK531_05550 [Rhodococcus spelaei]|uniref:Uncharacterized protein n=2 Tax=Rhodococcus spelaei TaxID=2546320 RepID=A0A541BPU9_9NOCA|nr:hypothetical protein FK531_05550 [Rhodococcus spelaei]
MRSDREEIPEDFTKEDADKAETMEARIIQQQSARGATLFLTPGCQVYWPAPYEVCGAIKDKYNSLGGPSSFLLWPTTNELTNPDGVGKRTQFMNGPIYWSPTGGAHPVVNSFLNRWGVYGYEAGFIGYPTTDEIVHPDGVGRRQEFQNATIYVSTPNAIGSVVRGAIRDKYNSLGGYSGTLGYPMTDEQASVQLLQPTGGTTQVFQHGMLVWNTQTNAVAIAGWQDMSQIPSAAASAPATQPSAAAGGGVTPMFQSGCPAGTTGYTGAQAAFNCVVRYQDQGGTWINLRSGKGDPNGFGQLHYKTDHQVKDRWVELLLQDSYGVPTSFNAEGTGVTANPDRYRYAQGLYTDFAGQRNYLIALQVIVDFAPTNQVSDNTQFGIVTSYCSDPNNNDNIIQFCPQLPPPYL